MRLASAAVEAADRVLVTALDVDADAVGDRRSAGGVGADPVALDRVPVAHELHADPQARDEVVAHDALSRSHVEADAIAMAQVGSAVSVGPDPVAGDLALARRQGDLDGSAGDDVAIDVARAADEVARAIDLHVVLRRREDCLVADAVGADVVPGDDVCPAPRP